MDDTFSQQIRKGVLGMLVLELLCRERCHGYGLQQRLKESSAGLFDVKEGTLYPILYRLEDEGFIQSLWSRGEGRARPQKIYEVTQKGQEESLRRRVLWAEFAGTVEHILKGGTNDEH